ncbi:MAG: outer membrane protein transport protein [Thermodesulfobacteriota bacterium]|nr:outer membrane protein transport protein [Thermodesulfobacteriota bacterium]
MRLKTQTRTAPILFITAVVFLLCINENRLCHAAFFENIAVHAKAISLANSCVAYPPGHMAIHYNPAGLSNLHAGKQLSLGLLTADLSIESSFNADPDFDGWLDTFSNQDDPLDGTNSSVEGWHLYMPILGEQDTDIIGVDTPAGFLPAAPFPLGLSYREPGSRWTFGFGAYAPTVGGYYRSDADPGRYNGRAVSMQQITYAAPSVSYQLTDTLSLGLTVSLSQGATQMDLDMRMPNDLMALTKTLGDATEGLTIPIVSQLTLPAPWFGGGIGPYEDFANLNIKSRDDYCPGYNIGLLWEPKNWFSFGANYQSKVRMEQQGTYKFSYNENWQRMVNWFGSSVLLLPISVMLDLPYNATPYQAGNVYMDGFDAPQRVQMGVMLRPFKRLRLMCDAHWIDYSETKKWTIQFDQNIQVLQLAKLVGHADGSNRLTLTRDMEDEIHMSYGAELQLLEWLFLRCGYEDRKTSVSRQYFDVIAPVPDLDFYGAGLGIKLKSGVEIDLSVGYLESERWYVPNNTSDNLNSTDFTDAVYNPYGGLDVSGEMDITVVAANVSMPFKYIYRISNILKDSLEKTKELIPFH